MGSTTPTRERLENKHGVRFVRRPLARAARREALLFHDAHLPEAIGSFATFSASFAASMSVPGGEASKALADFPALYERVLAAATKAGLRRPVFHVAGGGSVGDCGGFLASVFRRGMPLELYPSTWLAAVDSSHGGKNALNAGGAKNQLGTFHRPRSIWICSEWLEAQPPELARAAMGEAAKAALLDGGTWTRAFAKAAAKDRPAALQNFLPELIAAKYRVVERDPREESGVRRLLNLGHTVGHVIEASRGIAHGDAVGCGLWFTLRWSRERRLLSERDFRWASEELLPACGVGDFGARGLSPLESNHFQTLLGADKKASSPGKVAFVFLRSVGAAEVGDVSPAKLVGEARRQGLVLP